MSPRRLPASALSRTFLVTPNPERQTGMTSLFEPDMEVLDHFHGFGDWGRVVCREKVATRRLDDVDIEKREPIDR